MIYASEGIFEMCPAMLVHEFEWHGRCDSTSLWRLISAPDDVFGCIGTALGSHTIWVIMRSVAPCHRRGFGVSTFYSQLLHSIGPSYIYVGYTVG